MKKKKFEIDKDLIIEKLDINKGSTLLVTVDDPAVYDLFDLHETLVEKFPDNNIFITCKGISIEEIKLKKEDDDTWTIIQIPEE